jgi:hypothetical protein
MIGDRHYSGTKFMHITKSSVKRTQNNKKSVRGKALPARLLSFANTRHSHENKANNVSALKSTEYTGRIKLPEVGTKSAFLGAA